VVPEKHIASEKNNRRLRAHTQKNGTVEEKYRTGGGRGQRDTGQPKRWKTMGTAHKQIEKIGLCGKKGKQIRGGENSDKIVLKKGRGQTSEVQGGEKKKKPIPRKKKKTRKELK